MGPRLRIVYMKTIESSEHCGGTAIFEEEDSSPRLSPSHEEFLWGGLEYDHDHGDEVFGAKRENIAQGHCLFGAE